MACLPSCSISLYPMCSGFSGFMGPIRWKLYHAGFLSQRWLSIREWLPRGLCRTASSARHSWTPLYSWEEAAARSVWCWRCFLGPGKRTTGAWPSYPCPQLYLIPMNWSCSGFPLYSARIWYCLLSLRPSYCRLLAARPFISVLCPLCRTVWSGPCLPCSAVIWPRVL